MQHLRFVAALAALAAALLAPAAFAQGAQHHLTNEFTGAGKCLVGADVLDGRSLPEARPVTGQLRAALIRRIARECGVPEASVRF